MRSSSFVLLSICLVLVALVPAPVAAAAAFANPAFEAQWRAGEATAPNFWGPLATARDGQQEPYAGGQRLVQYFDKGRMELAAGGRVTNGLLATEVVRGQVQVGDATFEPKAPPAISVAGDADNPGPTYAQLSGRASALLAATPNQTDSRISRGVTASGDLTTGNTPNSPGTTLTAYDGPTRHNVTLAFAQYRERAGLATIGYAISEPFFATVKVGGQMRDVVIQVFERRVLTYTATNPEPFTVEMGNIGQHYYQWRYGGAADVPVAAVAATTGSLPPLPNGMAYRDQFGRFTTRYPVGWSVRVDGDNNANFLSPQAPPAAGINVSPRPVSDNVTLDNYRRDDHDFLLPLLKDYRQISDTRITVGGNDGYKRVYTITNDEGQFEMIVRYHIRTKGYVVVVNCFAAPQNEGTYMPLFDGTTGAIETLAP